MKTRKTPMHHWLEVDRAQEESCIHYFTPKKKAASPVRKKFKATSSTGQMRLTVFWDSQGVLLHDFLEVGTINATWYCVIQSKLKEEILKKWPVLLRPSVLLLDDNGRLHSVTAMQKLIAALGWEHLYHPPLQS
ncbi:histone-lysine N-methyltransferase SETMAR [Trichonephila clavipes]|nr:histone-lysine N-methyltransferase SETMAR [Trichonephila clavipes]